MTDIRDSIERVVGLLADDPGRARSRDTSALAHLGRSLSVTVTGPGGEMVATDMPRGIGGLAEQPTPGWLYRAAIASCVATTIGMEAARKGVTLDALEVEVDSESDDRGILGIDPAIPPGPLSARIMIRAAASGVDAERLRRVLEDGAARCPVCDATKRAIPVTTEIEIL